jgi:hypothetical protein
MARQGPDKSQAFQNEFLGDKRAALDEEEEPEPAPSAPQEVSPARPKSRQVAVGFQSRSEEAVWLQPRTAPVLDVQQLVAAAASRGSGSFDATGAFLRSPLPQQQPSYAREELQRHRHNDLFTTVAPTPHGLNLRQQNQALRRWRNCILSRCGPLLKRYWVYEALEEYYNGERPEKRSIGTQTEKEQGSKWASRTRYVVGGVCRITGGVVATAKWSLQSGVFVLKNIFRTRRSREEWFKLGLRSLKNYAPFAVIVVQNLPVDISTILHEVWEHILA